MLTQVSVHDTAEGKRKNASVGAKINQSRYNKDPINSLLLMQILQRRRKVVNDNEPIEPNLVLLLPLHVHDLP